VEKILATRGVVAKIFLSYVKEKEEAKEATR